jgi:SnoaL-like domain
MTTSPSLANETADRLAVVDALYRFAAGIDLRDESLLSSSLAENAVSDFRPAAAKAGFEYPVIEGRDAIVAALTTSLATLDTTHSVTNPRVTIDGDNARLDALVEAQHVPRHDHTRHHLRTLHATFAAQGSSLSKPRCQNRRHLEDSTFKMCTCSRRVMQ